LLFFLCQKSPPSTQTILHFSPFRPHSVPPRQIPAKLARFLLETRSTVCVFSQNTIRNPRSCKKRASCLSPRLTPRRSVCKIGLAPHPFSFSAAAGDVRDPAEMSVRIIHVEATPCGCILINQQRRIFRRKTRTGPAIIWRLRLITDNEGN
jgi:hypothetical protein